MRSVPSVEVGGQVQPVQLGKYAILGAIGRGGMADVYLAMARGPSGVRKLVVVKCMRAASDVDGTLAQMFLDEGRLAALLNHSHVVHTYEVGQGDDGWYIVMEYLHGQPLSAVARVAKPLDPRLSARIAADALSGLHYAHELRDLDGTPLCIVHRDLSPPNIFVTHEGVVKLVDFGIAKTAIATRASTEAGLVKGKFAYMAPEQATGGVVDRRADIYAMGVVLWELLAGRRLVEGLSPASIVRRALHGSAPLVSSVRAEIDPALDQIVERALTHDPEARYATALEMREALEEFLAQGPVPSSKDLGQLMAEYFCTQREAREQQIQSWVAAFTPEQPTRLQIANQPETTGYPPLIEQISGSFQLTPRLRRTPLLSRQRLVEGALILGALSLGVIALYKNQGKASNRPEAAQPTVAVVSGLVSSPITEPGSALSSEPPATPPAAIRSSPPLARVARSPQAATARSPAAPAPAVPSATTAVSAPSRTAPQRAKTSPALESNPYLHSR